MFGNSSAEDGVASTIVMIFVTVLDDSTFDEDVLDSLAVTEFDDKLGLWDNVGNRFEVRTTDLELAGAIPLEDDSDDNGVEMFANDDVESSVVPLLETKEIQVSFGIA